MRDLSFCYLCGEPLQGGGQCNYDHLPPSSLFLKEDRTPPLLLATHVACNDSWSNMDELLGVLVSFIHGRPLGPRVLKAEAVTINGSPATHVYGLDVPAFVRRCMRGFHAALYGEWLAEDTDNAIHPSIHGVAIDRETGQPADPVQQILLTKRGLAQHTFLTEILKKNRYAQNTDRVITRNGKCVYECVWTRTYGCIFGLKIYDWHRCGELLGYQNRGCVGMYRRTAGQPPTATRETDLEFSFPNQDELDPFGG